MSTLQSVMNVLLSSGNTGDTGDSPCFIRENACSHPLISNGNTGNTHCNEAGTVEAAKPFNQAAMDKIKTGYPVKVWSGVLQEWLIWVRGETERNKLIKQGCTLPIYTLGELAVVAKRSSEDLRNIHQMKKIFNATITEKS